MGFKVLILEDSELDAELMKRELQRRDLTFESRTIHEQSPFEQEFKNWKPDIVISDYNLIGYTGGEALAFCKKENPKVPFIAVSGSISKKMELELLQKRANDVLQKNDMARLPFAVQRALNERDDKQALEKKQEELEKLLKEKEILVQEVHHRVKNNLALFSGFLELDRMMHVNPEVDEVLGHIILRVKSIAVIHELIYQTASFSMISVPKSLYKIFNFYIHAENLSYDEHEGPSGKKFECRINQVIPLGLLVNELLNHAFKVENGWDKNVAVSFEKSGSDIRIDINSNDLATSLESEKNGKDGFGDIIDALISQIPGEININKEKSLTTITFEQL